MKKYLIAAAILATFAANTATAADIGVSVSIGQPGFYGQIDINNYPQPQVFYREPKMIYRSDMNRPPIYLRVPPGHRKNWRRHCREYNACGERVYFVQDNWYEQQYVPRYQKQHHEHRGDDQQRMDDHQNNRGGNDHGNNGNHRGGNDHGKGNRGRD